MRYLFKRLDQQTTTAAHPQWAMGTHRSALSLQLGRVVADLDTPFSFKFPLFQNNVVMVTKLAGVVCVLYLVAAPPGDVNPEPALAREFKNSQTEI